MSTGMLRLKKFKKSPLLKAIASTLVSCVFGWYNSSFKWLFPTIFAKPVSKHLGLQTLVSCYVAHVEQTDLRCVLIFVNVVEANF